MGVSPRASGSSSRSRAASGGGAAAADEISYGYKPSLAGIVYSFVLKPRDLAWWTSRRSETWAYQDITSIRMSFRPSSIQARRYRTEIRNSAGQRVVVMSTTWQSMALMAPQDDSYRAFIVELHKRVAASSGTAVMQAGLRPWQFYLALAVFACLMLAMTGLLAQAIMTASTSAALFFVALMAVLVWQIGGFVWRNRPMCYSADALPAHLLP